MARKIITAVCLVLISAASASACDMSYFLKADDGRIDKVNPDNKIQLEKGSSYTLTVNFSENHGRCAVEADETVFLLNDEKWTESKDYMPLVLEKDFEWESSGSKDHSAELSFTVKEKGKIYLEVIRECDRKEGYDEYLIFNAE